jgi:hypothetical protein
MNEQMKKRLQSFAWRSGVMLAVAVLNIVSTNIGLLELPSQYVVVIGLVLGEVTKYLNTTIQS